MTDESGPPDEPQPTAAKQRDGDAGAAIPVETIEQRKARLREQRILQLEPYKFPKGVSGNPSGRPKAMTRAYEELLENEITEKMAKVLSLPAEFAGMTFREAIALGVGAQGARGSVQAAQEIADRTEGKVESSLKVHNESVMEEILRKLWEKKMAGARPTLDVSASIGDEFEGEAEEEPGAIDEGNGDPEPTDQ